MSPGRLDALIWTLIYGGLILVGIGLAVVLAPEGGFGGGIVAAGAVLAVLGVLLIWVRSRMKER